MTQKRILVTDKGIPGGLLWMMAIISGFAVANMYYSQPLLNLICADLGISEFTANLIPMLSQAGYAAGLVFIIPLGDMLDKKKLLITEFSILILSLTAFAFAGNIHLLMFLSVLIGIGSVVPQVFMPIASQYSVPEKKAQNTGIILSGLLVGILGSRVISGIAGEYFGWRSIYYIAIVLMLLCICVIGRFVPETERNFKGSYKELMRSVLSLFRNNGTLRLLSIRAGIGFASFYCLWACLAFKMSGEPFNAGNDIIGLLGLCGIVGAVTASFIGKYITRFGVRNFNFIGCFLIIASWIMLWAGQNSYVWIIAGIIIIDIGIQCIQLSNQTCALALDPSAVSRVNTIFMTCFFIGGTLGTFVAGSVWALFGWAGICATGIVLTLISLSMTLFSRK